MAWSPGSELVRYQKRSRPINNLIFITRASLPWLYKVRLRAIEASDHSTIIKNISAGEWRYVRDSHPTGVHRIIPEAHHQ